MNVYEKITSLIDHVQNEGLNGFHKVENGDLATYLIANNVIILIHAKWEKDPGQKRCDGHIYDYRCSNCKGSAHKGYYNNYDNKSNYCPHCGARMDLED